LNLVGDNCELAMRKRNHCKSARAPKQPVGCEVVDPWLVDNLCIKVPFEVLGIHGRELPDDQHGCAGSAG